MITVGLGNESGWAKKINYKYIKKQKNKMKKKKKQIFSATQVLLQASSFIVCLFE